MSDVFEEMLWETVSKLGVLMPHLFEERTAGHRNFRRPRPSLGSLCRVHLLDGGLGTACKIVAVSAKLHVGRTLLGSGPGRLATSLLNLNSRVSGLGEQRAGRQKLRRPPLRLKTIMWGHLGSSFRTGALDWQKFGPDRAGIGLSRSLPVPPGPGSWERSTISIPDSAQLVSDRFGTPPGVQISERHTAVGRESANMRGSLSGTLLQEVGM